MAVSWVASGTLAGGTTADVTPVNPTHQADDILVLLTTTRVTTETCLTPSGWSVLAGVANGTAWACNYFWIRATASGTTNPLCDWSAAVGEKYGQVHVIRGAITTGNPFPTAVRSVTTADPAVLTPGLTTTAADQYVFVAGLVRDNVATAATVTATDPAAWTQRHYSTIATGADAGAFFHDAVRATVGATGDITVDFNGVPLGHANIRAAVNVPPLPSVPYRNRMPQLLAH